MPLVSVVIPCFNKSALVEEAVKSVLRSQYPHLEVIVVDDGSTDEQTKAALVRLERLPQVKVAHQPNTGVAAARMRGVSLAKGTYLLFLDNDDLVSENLISEGVAFLEKHPAVGYTYPSTVFFGDRQGLWMAGTFHPQSLSWSNFIPCTCLHRREVVAEVPFDTSIPVLEDWDFLLRLLKKGVHGAPLPATYLFYRIIRSTSRDASASHKARKAVVREIRKQHQVTGTLPQRTREFLSPLLLPVVGPVFRRREYQTLKRHLQEDSYLAREAQTLGISL